MENFFCTKPVYKDGEMNSFSNSPVQEKLNNNKTYKETEKHGPIKRVKSPESSLKEMENYELPNK